jgi:4-amino-4-deoxy-L-arabinose transferase-like glycosyltransferase
MRLALAALLALTALRLALAATLPLAPDEAYYFLWSTHLQAGYFDHPPMVALWIKAGTALCGNTALGVRLLGPLSAFFGSVLLWDAGERLIPGRRAGLMAAALLNATLMVGVGAIIITPDTPLLFFWTCGLAALARLVASGNPRWWLAVGLAAGAMLLSKYTAALFIAAVFLWLLFTPTLRKQLRSPWPWAAVALALALFAPNLAWNATHGWVSYFKQGERVAHFDAARATQFFIELAVGQAALFTPGVAVLAGFGIWRLRRETTPGARLLLWLTLVPVAIFLEHVLSDRVQGNWVAIIYPSACLAAALAPPARWLKPALGLGFGITALAYVQALAGPFPIPARMDTSALQLSGWQHLGQDAAASRPAFLTADDYATAAALAFYAPKNVPVLGFDKRWDYFNWPHSGQAGETGIMVTRRNDADCPDELGRITRKRGAEIITTYRLCRFTVRAPGVELPRP